MQKIHYQYLDFIKLILNEEKISDDRNIIETEQAKWYRIADQKYQQLEILCQNVAFFTNMMRKKQVLIEVKKELKRAIDSRNEDIEVIKD